MLFAYRRIYIIHDFRRFVNLLFACCFEQKEKPPEGGLSNLQKLLLCSDDRILHVLGNHVVAGHVEVEPAAALGHGAQGENIFGVIGRRFRFATGSAKLSDLSERFRFPYDKVSR